MSVRKRIRRKKGKSLNTLPRCGNCQSIDIVDDVTSGTKVCRGCGRVLDSSMISNSPSAVYSDGCSGMISSRGTGIGTVSTSDLRKSFDAIESLCQTINLHEKFVKKAKELYKDLKSKKGTIGRSVVSLYCACIHMSCKLEKFPRSLQEISVMGNIQIREVNNACKHVEKVLHLKNELNDASRTLEPFTSLSIRYCHHLNLSKNVSLKVENACRAADEKRLFQGKKPNTVVAGIIYLVTQEEIGEEEDKVGIEKISNVLGITTPTILKFHKNELKKISKRLLQQ